MKKIFSILFVLALSVSLVTAAPVAADNENPTGSGKSPLYLSPGCTPDGGATTLDETYGFVIMNTNSNRDLIVQVSLKDALPDTTYDIWVNQWDYTGNLGAPTHPAALTTNGVGNGNAHVVDVRGPMWVATKFWVSVTGGSQMLRSTSVVLD